MSKSKNTTKQTIKKLNKKIDRLLKEAKKTDRKKSGFPWIWTSVS